MKKISYDFFMNIFNLCRGYDPFTQYIDNYNQMIQAEKANKDILNKFKEIMKTNFSIEVSYIPFNTTTAYSNDEAMNYLKEWFKDYNIEIIEKTKRIWDKNEIKILVQTNDKVLYGSLKALYNCQTADEKSYHDTTERNGKGFNGVDAQFLSSCAEYLIKHGFLTDKQKIIVRKKMIKYTNQLTILANER